MNEHPLLPSGTHRSYDSDTANPQFANALLALFLWLNLSVLSGVGGIVAKDAAGVGLFVSAGVLCLSACALLCGILGRRKKDFRIPSICCYTVLSLLPLAVTSPENQENTILLDLYYILLVAAPPFLKLWSWRFQAVASAIVLACVCFAAVPVSTSSFIQSILLVGVAGMLATLVVFSRSKEQDAEGERLEQEALQLLSQAASGRLSQLGGSAVLLEAGLVIVLIFLDIAFGGERFLPPLMTKVYALMAIVFGSLLMKVAKQKNVAATFGATTVAVALVLSIARLGYTDVHGFVASIPLVYLAFVVTVLPFSLAFQIAVVWAVLFNDLLVKLVWEWSRSAGGVEVVGLMLTAYRGEIAFLALGSAASVTAAGALQYHRTRNVTHFVDSGKLSSGEFAVQSVAGIAELKPVPLASAAREAIDRERRQRLVSGILLVGVPSCIVASRLLLTLGTPLLGTAVVGWVTFAVLWVSLVYLDRKDDGSEFFWMLGAFAELVLFLWPCILLLISPDAGLYWLFWPLCLFLGVGLIPWRIQELIPLLLVSLVAGVQLIYQLKLGAPGAAMCTAAVLLGLLWSVHGNRQLKEKLLLLTLHEDMERAGDETAVLRVLGDYLMGLFDASSALARTSSEQLEVLHAAKAYPVSSDYWPMQLHFGNAREIKLGFNGVVIRSANWIPTPFRFFYWRYGVFSAAHGLILSITTETPEFRGNERLQSGLYPAMGRDERAYDLFLALRLPVYDALRSGELKVAGTMAGISRLRLAQLEERRLQRRVEEGFEARFQDREYELGALVHDVNNTVQDLTLLCDGILEDVLTTDGAIPELRAGMRPALSVQVKRIADVARSVATVISDSKRKRELERMSDLQPRELIDVTMVIEEIGSFAAIRAERKRIQVELPVLPQEKVWVRVSVREHLETILRNLFNNAILYSRAGAVVKLLFRYDQNWVWIDVVDNGPGLSAEEQQAVFRSGYRGKSSSGIPGGLGLGLAESRRVAESAGGSLEVSSLGEDRGSTFTVTLPRQAAPVAMHGVPPWALLVDDQPALTEFYSRLAKALQFSPGVAASAAEALELVRKRGQPAFVITDIHLGVDNGLVLVEQLRREFGSLLPILVVSGLTEDDIAERARSAGASDFVSKPVGRRALFARIQSLLPGT